MPILTNIGLLARCSPSGGQAAVHILRDAAVAWRGDTIVWVGSMGALRGPDGPLGDASMLRASDREEIDAGRRLVIPGLVDCHTHLAFGGWRADEFALRSRGAGYLEIQEAGGGIRSTMRATREVSEDGLYERAESFLDRMLRLGVTTVECKSGYGLTMDDELKLLRVYQRLSQDSPQLIVPTFLGAHVVPPEFATAEAYVDHLVDDMLPAVAAEGLATFCDVFVEEGAFDVDLAERLLRAAAGMGLRPKLHVDQLSDGGGGVLAARVRAASADHLEFTSAEGMLAMASAGVIAVSLPLASLYLRQPPMDARAFLEAGCAVAVATDFNPGSAPSYHLPLALTLACTLNRLTPAEALKGATQIAADAIGMSATVGSIDPGKRADFVLLDADSVEQWIYHFVPNAVHQVYAGGRPQLVAH